MDFDFFSPRPLQRDAIRNALPFTANATVLQDERNTWALLVSGDTATDETVKLSFSALPSLGRARLPDTTVDGVLQVASLDDLMATKLKVILQRAEAKDYRDIAAILNANVDLARGPATARAIYGPNFQPSESLKALTWFEDGDLLALHHTEKSCWSKPRVS